MIIIDSNDATSAPEIHRALKQQFQDVTVARLSCGDLLALANTGVVVVERKTPNDLLGSIADGRIFDQVRRMVDVARFPFVVIHGSIICNHDGKVVANGRVSGWQASSVEMALVAVQAAGAIVVQTKAGGYVETVKHLLTWCERADDRWIKRKSVHWLPSDAKRDFLAQLPGVGSQRVDALIECYRDRPLIELLSRASTPSADLPHLWGNVTVAKVREFLGLCRNQFIEIREHPEEDKNSLIDQGEVT